MCLPELSYPLCESAGQQQHHLSGVSAVPKIPLFSLWHIHGWLPQRTAKNNLHSVRMAALKVMYTFNSFSLPYPIFGKKQVGNILIPHDLSSLIWNGSWLKMHEP